ncbi:MAG TPA: cupredoxin domain-containing protein [Alphaproteobacteria bacterium]|nr:cupredoxin domain-containing protein [Alphaproteobacteria bacterium]
MATNIQTGLIATLAGLVAAVAASQATSLLAQDAPKLVTVQAKEYAFVPSDLHLEHGAVYRLHLQNVGKETHELTAPDFFKAAQIETPDILSGEGREILVQPGESKDLVFRAPAAGTYAMTCADHDWAGMVGKIIVE